MRIYLSSEHSYPGWRYGVAAHTVHDNLARGLSELAHEVRYYLHNSNTDTIHCGRDTGSGFAITCRIRPMRTALRESCRYRVSEAMKTSSTSTISPSAMGQRPRCP